MRLTFILTLFLCLSACATGPTAEECASNDWENIGFNHGRINKGKQKSVKLTEQCEKHGVTFDLASYDKGYAKGLNVFCRPQGGFNAGLKGQSLTRADICSTSLRPEFLLAYNKGKGLYDQRQRTRIAKNNLDNALRAVDRESLLLEKLIIKLDHLKKTDETFKEEQKKILKKIKESENRVDYNFSLIPEYEDTLFKEQALLEKYEAEMVEEGWLK